MKQPCLLDKHITTTLKIKKCSYFLTSKMEVTYFNNKEQR